MRNDKMIEPLSWDTDFFGFPIARLRSGPLTDESLQAAMARCRKQAIRCVYFLAPAADFGTLQLAQQAGFELVDVRVTLSRPLSGRLLTGSPMTGDIPEWKLPHTVREATTADLAALLPLAEPLARVSRFGLDPRFGLEQATRLYEQWLQKETAVSLVVDGPAGMGGLITIQQDGTHGIIDLLATAPTMQRRGLGKVLCAAGLRWMRENGCRTASVITQGHNIASQRVYQQNGFLTSTVEISFHKWFDTDE